MGLFTMRERVALAGGRFEIESRPGVGTHITASVPAARPIEDNPGGVSK
jgi:signal transduction histidine kinase